MATDYDTPRKTDDELGEDSIEELKARRVDKSASTVDVDETASELMDSILKEGRLRQSRLHDVGRRA